MFDNKSKIECYTYKIDLTKPISFICKLANEMFKLLPEEYSIDRLFEKSFIQDEVQILLRQDEEGKDIVGIDQLSAAISDYYNKNIINRIDLKKSEILLIHQPSKTIYIYNKERRNGSKKESKEYLKNSIMNKKIFIELIDKLQSANLISSLKSSIEIQFVELFSNVINIIEQKDFDIPFVPYAFFDEEKVKYDLIDEQDIWMNKTKFNEEFSLGLKDQTDVYLLEAKNNNNEFFEVGILYGDLVFPITPYKLENLINKDSLLSYFWLQLCNVFIKEKERSIGEEYQILSNFKEDMKKEEMNKLLSFLIKNVYLPNDFLEETSPFNEYFNDVYKVNGLTHLEEYNFFVSTENGKTAIGIYTDIKKDNNFNLLHWGMKEDNKLINYRSIEAAEKIELPFVKALKPEIAFYFITNYFEDFLENAIIDSGLQYIRILNYILMELKLMK